MVNPHKNDIIGLFAQHPVAANLVMVIMLLSGMMALGSLNTQFFPSFEVEVVSVRVIWSGATPEDVERSIIVQLEHELRTVDGVDKITSSSSQGAGAVLLEFPEGTDMGQATDRVQERVNSVRNLPQDAEQPQVSHLSNFDPIAKMLIHGPSDMRELRMLARRFERELLARGVAKIDMTGLPTEEIAVQIPMQELQALDMSLAQAASRIADASRDLPAGTVGKQDVGRQLRSLSQRRDVSGFEQLPLATDKSGQLVRVGQIRTTGAGGGCGAGGAPPQAQSDRHQLPGQAGGSASGFPLPERRFTGFGTYYSGLAEGNPCNPAARCADHPVR